MLSNNKNNKTQRKEFRDYGGLTQIEKFTNITETSSCLNASIHYLLY